MYVILQLCRQFWYEQVKHQQFMMAGALNRMRNLKLSQAWEKWQYEYEEAKRLQYMLSGAIKRMQNLKLSQAWESWQAPCRLNAV